MAEANLGRSALIVIDMINKYDDECRNKKSKADRRIEVINEASDIFRKNGRPVIFVKCDEPPREDYEGNDPDGLLPGLIREETDISMYKKRMSAFDGTVLSDVLEIYGCDTVVLAGMLVQYCVMGTYYGAMELSLSPFLLKNGTLAWGDEYNDAAYLLCDSLSVKDIKRAFRPEEEPVSEPPAEEKAEMKKKKK